MIDAAVLRCLLGPSAFMTLATRRPVPAPERAGLLALLALVLGTLSSSTTFGASLRPSRHCDCFCENLSTRCSPTLPELDCSTSCTSQCVPDGLKPATDHVGPCRGKKGASPPVAPVPPSRE